MPAKRKPQDEKYQPQRGRINLNFDLSDPEQRECYEGLMQRGHPTRDVLEMWRGQSTEVLFVRSSDVLDLKALVKEVIRNSAGIQGFPEENEPEEAFDEDAFDGMMEF